MKSQAQRPRTAPRPINNRARVSNRAGTVLPGTDGRSAVARRFHDLMADIASDLGGVERISTTKLALVQRFAALAITAESAEAKMAEGQALDIMEATAIASALVRLASRIGLGRAQKLVPSLREYLASKERPGAPFDDDAADNSPPPGGIDEDTP